MLYNEGGKNKKKRHLSTLLIVIFTLSLLFEGCGSQNDTERNFSEISSDSEKENNSDSMREASSEPVKASEPAGSYAGHNSYDQTEETGAALVPITQLHVNGSQLTDNSGNPVQLKGISTHGLAWFPDYVNKDCFRQMHDEWNVNVIRLAMYTSEYGGYCNGGNKNELEALIKNGVEYAAALNMYAIIDWHILSDGNPNLYKEEAKAFFAEMAKSYADYDNVLYEICNEPNGGTNWEDIKAYANEIIPVIRSYDKNGIIIVGTPNWSQYVDQAAASPITGYDNIMYSLHFYSATHTDSLRNTLKEAISAGLPVFVTEYSICDASGNGAIDEDQANQWIRLLDEYGISYVFWNLSNKNEASAILSSACNKTSGFTKDDLSASGKWLYQILTEDQPLKPLSSRNSIIKITTA